MTTNFAALKATFDALGISYTTATLSNEYYKQVVDLTNGIRFVFDDRGRYVTVKRER